YSSGMYMRLGFAIAAHIEADILLLDEVFAVGDEAFQRKCFGKIFEFKQRGGTIVFVSHDASPVERLCDRAVLLKDGLVAFDGPAAPAACRFGSRPTGRRSPTAGCTSGSTSPTPRAGRSTTRSTTRSSSSSIPATRRAGSSSSKVGGRQRRSRPPPNLRGCEL